MFELGDDPRAELAFVKEVADENPKNYQIWYHRRVLVERLKDPSLELAFTEEILAEDSKNYHAWAHRQWVVAEFKLWDAELAFVNVLLSSDIRNNSAWNHRWFVISRTTGWTTAVRREEVDYAFDRAVLAPSNPCPWTYLLGVLRGQRQADFPNVAKGLERVEAAGYTDCVELLSFRVRLATRTADVPAADVLAAATTCDQLAVSDAVRKVYWTKLGQSLRSTAARAS